MIPYLDEMRHAAGWVELIGSPAGWTVRVRDCAGGFGEVVHTTSQHADDAVARAYVAWREYLSQRQEAA